jgi:hypothetical protein
MTATVKKVKSNYAFRHLRSGICFRGLLLQESIRMLINGINNIDTDTFAIDQINVAINSIYINIRGIIDNISWVLKYEYSINISVNNVFIGNEKFRKKLEEKGCQTTKINVFDDWLKELKEKRDPITHRLPLYIPDKIIDNSDDAKKAEELRGQVDLLMSNNDREWLSKMSQIKRIGSFKPYLFLNNSIDNEDITVFSIEHVLINDFQKLNELTICLLN